MLVPTRQETFFLESDLISSLVSLTVIYAFISEAIVLNCDALDGADMLALRESTWIESRTRLPAMDAKLYLCDDEVCSAQDLERLI